MPSALATLGSVSPICGASRWLILGSVAGAGIPGTRSSRGERAGGRPPAPLLVFWYHRDGLDRYEEAGGYEARYQHHVVERRARIAWPHRARRSCPELACCTRARRTLGHCG